MGPVRAHARVQALDLANREHLSPGYRLRGKPLFISIFFLQNFSPVVSIKQNENDQNDKIAADNSC